VANLTGDGIITGEVNVKQIVPEFTQYYHYLCSPVGESGENTAYTISTQFLDNTTHDNVYDWSNLYFNTSFPDWYVYNEAECLGDTPAEVQATYNNINVSLTTQQATWLLTAFGWTSNDNLLTQAIPLGTGVLSRVGFDLTGKVLSWSGTLNNGHIEKTLELTTCDFGDGLNFVGNPYATPLDWEQVYSDNNADISPFAYVWTPDPSATSPFGASPSDGYFTVYDATSSTSTIPHPDFSDESGAAVNTIAIGQGFLVRALNDNVVLDFYNGQRIGDNYTFLLRESKPKDALQLIVEGEKGKDYTNIYLSDLFVNEGSSIKQGELLFNVTAAAQNATLDAASQVLMNARKNLSSSSSVLNELSNTIANAKLKLKNDSINYFRYKSLNEKNAVASIDFEKMKLNYETSRNELQSAIDRYNKTKLQLSAEEKNATATLENAQKERDYYSLKAATSGTVFKLMKENGEAVKRGELVAIIGNSNHYYIKLNVDASDINNIKDGQLVLIKTDIDKSKIYKAHVSKIYPMMNASDQSFRVDAEFEDKYEVTFNGTNAEANIIISTKQNILTIPKNCLASKDSVWVEDNGDEKKIKITTGIENFDEIEVISGLTKDSKIIIKN
jgi:multidrug efflux pump subunit AcrA (membrane-fusion protein)